MPNAELKGPPAGHTGKTAEGDPESSVIPREANLACVKVKMHLHRGTHRTGSGRGIHWVNVSHHGAARRAQPKRRRRAPEELPYRSTDNPKLHRRAQVGKAFQGPFSSSTADCWKGHRLDPGVLPHRKRPYRKKAALLRLMQVKGIFGPGLAEPAQSPAGQLFRSGVCHHAQGKVRGAAAQRSSKFNIFRQSGWGRGRTVRKEARVHCEDLLLDFELAAHHFDRVSWAEECSCSHRLAVHKELRGAQALPRQKLHSVAAAGERPLKRSQRVAARPRQLWRRLGMHCQKLRVATACLALLCPESVLHPGRQIDQKGNPAHRGRPWARCYAARGGR
eukprot:RCo046938